MKKIKLISGLFSALLLVSPLASANSDYPAANFKPTIVYQDDSVKELAQAAKSAPAPKAAAAAAAPAQSGGDDSMMLLAIVALAGVGFVAYKKTSGAPAKAGPSGSTGVSRYLERQEQSGGTARVSGVERYLQERV